MLRSSDSLSDPNIAQTGRTVTVSFEINFPILENCYVKISFPQEVPIDADETLQTYSGNGFIANQILPTQVIKRPYVYGANLATCACNYVLIPGCTDPVFLQSGSGQGIILMGDVISPSQVKTTGNFQIDFYSDQAMNSLIATTSTSTGLTMNFPASGLSGGAVTLTSFVPVTDNTIQAPTDFITTFSVAHNLYENSIIDITAPSNVSPTSGSTSCVIISMSSQFDSSITCTIYQTTPRLIFRIMNPFS